MFLLHTIDFCAILLKQFPLEIMIDLIWRIYEQI